MLNAFKKRATFANICAFLCLTIVLGMGSAYAKNTVRSADIVNGQVKTVDVANNGVTGAKVQDGGIGAADLAANSVGSLALQSDSVNATEIADNSIDGGEIVDNSLRASDLATDSVSATEIADNSIDGGEIVNDSLTTDDLAGADVNGSISLGAGAVPIGRCNFYDITVGGASPDQALVISARATLPAGQLLYGVEVPSAGHATMAACNFSGGAWDALSGFPIRVVTFG